MRRRLASALVALSVLLLCSATFSSSLAADYTKVGVKQGDQATYSIAMNSGVARYSVAMSPDTLRNRIPPSVTKLTVYVEKVTPPLVTVSLTLYESNGSVYSTEVKTENITRGLHGLSGIPVIVAADLERGDKPDLSPWVHTISATTQMTVAGCNRTVNYLNQATDSSGTYSYWWDKATGLLVGFLQYREYGTGAAPPGENPVYYSSYSWTLVSTTAFGGSTDSLLVLYVGAALGVVAVIIVTVEIASRRQGK